MISRSARYKVKPRKVPEARRAVAAFVRAVRRLEPGTLRYEAFQVDGTRDFLHVMTFRDRRAEAFHRGTPHAQRFVDALHPLCEEAPAFATLAPCGPLLVKKGTTKKRARRARRAS